VQERVFIKDSLNPRLTYSYSCPAIHKTRYNIYTCVRTRTCTGIIWLTGIRGILRLHIGWGAGCAELSRQCRFRSRIWNCSASLMCHKPFTFLVSRYMNWADDKFLYNDRMKKKKPCDYLKIPHKDFCDIQIMSCQWSLCYYSET
jgi:hypothetical protein